MRRSRARRRPDGRRGDRGEDPSVSFPPNKVDGRLQDELVHGRSFRIKAVAGKQSSC